MNLQQQERAPEPEVEQAPVQAPKPPGRGNGAMQERIAQQRDGGSTTGNAAPAAAVTPGAHVLARGADATAGAVGTYTQRLKAIAADWGLAWGAAQVVRTTDGEALVTLKWDPAWGDAPTTTDLSTSLEPVHARMALKVLLASGGYTKLPAADQPRVQALLGGETNSYGRSVRPKARGILVGSKASDTEQAKALGNLLTDDSVRPDLVDESNAALVAAKYTMGKPTLVKGYAFRGKKADANVTTLTFEDDKQEIKIVEPVEMGKDMVTHSVAAVADGIAKTPPKVRGSIHTVALNPVVNPDDAYWAKEYKRPDFHSYMTAGADGVVNVYPDKTPPPDADYMTGTFVHESSHAWSQKKWGTDTSKGGWVQWKAAMDKDKISVCDYATASLDEDLAETVTVYSASKGTPKFAEYKAMVPNRFAILDQELK